MSYAANTYDLYHDIQVRTKGEIYIGVVGPVRCGKSTFIKRFMEQLILPAMEENAVKERTMDEIPQSAAGKTITTTEPKFVPSEAVSVSLNEDVQAKMRLIDCVGYMVDGAVGHMENEEERRVKTPWFEEEIPFTQAAEIGTDKVMKEHSTIGIVITSDGTVTDLARENYLPAEEKVIREMKHTGKPFLVLLNSRHPNEEKTRKIANSIAEQYDVAALAVNCEALDKSDIHRILEKLLYEFPITSMEFFMPKWMELLPAEHELKKQLLEEIRTMIPQYDCIRNVMEETPKLTGNGVARCRMDSYSLADGVVAVRVCPDEKYYYQLLSNVAGEEIESEKKLLELLKELADKNKEYEKIQGALTEVRSKGYGVVVPQIDEISLEQPELIKHGNKYGVKMRALSPSIHMIKTNIETEIAPIVGSKEQAEDLMHYIREADEENHIWSTTIFGKTVEQLVKDGITTKITEVDEDSRAKLQDTMKKVVNDSNGGIVCIII